MGAGRSTVLPQTIWLSYWRIAIDVVVNLTSLEGRWSILLSAMAAKRLPAAGEKIQLDDLGLEIQWDKVKLLVTVVKDKAK